MNDVTRGPDKISLTFGDINAELPVLRAVDGRDAVDWSSFTKQTGLTSLDQGFVNTASTKSSITYIDGDEGILRYRGYAIEDFAANSTFLEVAWLLIYGELPTAVELDSFTERIRRHTLLHEDLKRFFSALPHTAHPMSVLSSAVSALSTYYEDSLDPHDPEMVELNIVRLLAKLPVIAAYAHKKSLGQAFLYPDNSLSFVDNFLKLNFGNLAEPYEINPVLSKALDRLLILHEDHEQNASTSTVRLVGSTEANIFASVSAGINALYGPLHGGANEAVLTMLAQIRDSGDGARRFVERVKNKEDGVRLMGFGHRVYKNGDHRAGILHELGKKAAATRGHEFNRLFELGEIVQKIMLEEKNIHPNVDFPCGMTYFTLGIPVPQYTPIFVASRVTGWCAHIMEQHANNRLIRPRADYAGPALRSWNES